MASANVFSQFAQPVKSVQDYNDERDAREVSRLALEDKRRQNALAAAAFQQQTADRNALQQFAQQSGGDTNKLIAALRGSGSAGLMTQADALEQSMLKRRDTESTIAGRDATTGKTQFDTQEAKRKAAVQQVAALNSPEEAKQLLNQQVAVGAVSMQAAQALGRMIDSDPKWQVRLVLGINDPKEMLAALQPHMVAAGGALVNTNPLAGPTGQGTANAIPITQTAANAAAQATAQRGQDMVDARAREANQLTREANANVYDPERGVLVNKATGLARPAATMDGKPVGPKDKPLPEGAQKQILGARNLQDAVQNYRDKLAGWSNGQMLSPDARAAMGNAYNNMMLQAKEAYNLGVLNGPDYDILQSVVKDPTKLTSALTSNGALDSQAAELARIAAGIEKTSLESHGKTYTPRAATGGPAQIKDDAGYNALPSGALFVGPDGKTRRKP